MAKRSEVRHWFCSVRYAQVMNCDEVLWQGVERNRIGIAKKVWHWQGEAMTVLLRRGEAQECKGMAMLGLALALCWPEMKCVGLVKSSKGTVKVCTAREWQ